MNVTMDMYVEDMLDRYPEANRFFLDKGLRCLQCGEPFWGSVEDFLDESNVEDKTAMLNNLNDFLKNSDSSGRKRIETGRLKT